MKIQLSLSILLFIVFALLACQPATEQTEADVVAIKALTVGWNTAIKAGDVNGLVALYTDDALQMPPNNSSNKGKEAIGKFYRSGLELFSIEATWPVKGTEEIIVSDGWAFYVSEFIEKFTPKAGGDPFEVRGKIIEVCQKQADGSWKFAREIWNLNSPKSKE